MNKQIKRFLCVAAIAIPASGVWAKCKDVSRDQLITALDISTATPSTSALRAENTGGYGLSMWVTMVDETGKVCHVVTDGKTGNFAGNSEWLGSRVISAQKANTANAFSLDGYAISTANLYSAVQPGGSLFGLQHSNPVDGSEAYVGDPAKFGTANDPLTRKRIGGVNVFGGGLALYKKTGTGDSAVYTKIGAIGVSGDTSCRDHAYAWRVRNNLITANPELSLPKAGITTVNMDAAGATQTPIGSAGDEMILNESGTDYWDAWSQPTCPNSTSTALKGKAAANGTIFN